MLLVPVAQCMAPVAPAHQQLRHVAITNLRHVRLKISYYKFYFIASVSAKTRNRNHSLGFEIGPGSAHILQYSSNMP